MRLDTKNAKDGAPGSVKNPVESLTTHRVLRSWEKKNDR